MEPSIGNWVGDDKDGVLGNAAAMPEDDSVDVGDWYQSMSLPLGFEFYDRLPRNEDFKYEFWDGKMHISPRPKVFQVVLPVTPREAPGQIVEAHDPISIRPMKERDWDEVTALFGPSFARAQPFASLNDEERSRAGVALLGNLRKGGEGPVIFSACHVAESRLTRGGIVDPGTAPELVGALLVTLYPEPEQAESWRRRVWADTPPPDAIERRLGRPHLTWIFVLPMLMGFGTGSAMLAHAVNELARLGYRELASSFSIGNPRSAMWHWRNGFQLLEYIGSNRRMRSWRRKGA